VAAEIGIDRESFMELFEDYVNESRDILAAMRSSAEEGDFKSCAHEGMKLQGMSDNMRVKSFDKELETAINSTQKDEVIGSINKIERIISHISSTGV
jgi:redox-regulated HSP33 family molecular chaperone